MGWIGLILKLLVALPQILSLVMQIIKLLKGLPPEMRALKAKQLKEAIAHAQATGDTAKVEALLTELCPGGNCRV